ncbi:hypothetical protein Aph01nite_47140 [Acrocarpospora phusangensis]|uniref:Peptidase S8/S53 domain-containing protein n=1 Tax=Acrocarpospora phusangensis TaxID=1070424 RepID=A0A919ULX1_9ACTN|nr:S8 family serine peptidase [Acrocarpospora phusangensis]GIH26404.1 hypothetical protein Aph01nite_47140 [Acrocarpospora phusangensis]
MSQIPENVYRGPLGAWWQDQIVVDLRHADLVRERLAKVAGIAWRELEVSTALDLVLVELPGLAEAAGAFRTDPALVEAAKASRSLAFGPDAPVPDLDLVLFALRKNFSDEYEGWTPTWGKHRLLDGVAGSPYTGGGDEQPEQADAVAIPEATGEGVRVGVLDTRLAEHPSLDGRYRAPKSAIFYGAEPYPSLAGHSMFICGAILQEAPDARLVVRSVLDDNGVTVSSWDVAVAMMGFLGEVEVLNMSFGCVTADHSPPLVLTRAVERLAGSMVLVAAAGNHGRLKARPDLPRFAEVTAGTPVWPAAYDEVIAVGATEDDPSAGPSASGAKADFSPNLPWVDAAVDGVGVVSTYFTGEVELIKPDREGAVTSLGTRTFGTGFARWSGTSFAAARISGKIARRAEEPGIDLRTARAQVVAEHRPPTK